MNKSSKRIKKQQKMQSPPLGKTLEINEIDHKDSSQTPQRTDRAVESSYEWTRFTQL